MVSDVVERVRAYFASYGVGACPVERLPRVWVLGGRLTAQQVAEASEFLVAEYERAGEPPPVVRLMEDRDGPGR